MIKNILLVLALFSSLGTYAQLKGDGYYRVKNASTGKFAKLVSSELDYNNPIGDIGGLHGLLYDTNCSWFLGFPTSGGKAYYITDSKSNGSIATLVEEINCYLQQDINLDNEAQNSASSIFYLEQKSGNNYNLFAQGANLYDITTGSYSGSKLFGKLSIGGFNCTISKIDGKDADSRYNIFMPIIMKEGRYTFDMGNYYFTDTSGKFKIIRDGSNVEQAKWYLEPATTFNVKPLSKVIDGQGHYWTTLCVDFPFSIPSSGSTVLAAYTVSGKDAKGYAVLTQISGTIPGGTPVLLECSSADETTNILNIDVNTKPASKECTTGTYVSGSDNNYLKGRYFDAAKMGYTYKFYYNKVSSPETRTLTTSGNYLTNDKTNYRVLNCVDGVVGFYKLKDDNKTMAANKAFLNIKELPTVPTASAKVFAVEGINETTGIDAVKNKAAHPAVYDLQGRRVDAPSSHGIYIVNGKKVAF